MALKLVMFDYDGVLMDTFSLTKDIYLEMSDEFGLDLPRHSEYFKELLELDWRVTYKKLRITTPEKIKKADEIFTKGLRKYDNTVRPYEGIPELLASLSKKYKLAVVTNNLKEEIRYRLAKFDLDRFFSAIYASEDGEPKPHPDLVNKCLKHFDTMPSDSAFIGDMDGDIKCAKAARVGMIIAVTYGYHLKPRLSGADFLVASPEMILPLLEGENQGHDKP